MSQNVINSLVRRVDQLELAMENAGLLVESPLLRRPPHGDPATVDLGRIKELIQSSIDDTLRINPYIYSDPATVDIPSLTAVELANKIHAINSDLVRINALKNTFTARLEELQK